MPGQVRFKFKSGLQHETVAFDGSFASVAEVKRLIAEKKGLGRDAGADLILSDPGTSKEYTDDTFQLPSHSCVEVRRAPVTKLKPLQAIKPSAPVGIAAQPQSVGLSPPAEEEDDFGGDLYSEQPVQAVVQEDEDRALREMLDGTAASWQREVQLASRGRGRGRGRGGRGVPPPHYVCHRCGQTGHYISDCPTNGDPNYDVKRVRIPVGIPMTRLARNQEGGLLLPDGQVGSLLANDDAFVREMAGLPTFPAQSQQQSAAPVSPTPAASFVRTQPTVVEPVEQTHSKPDLQSTVPSGPSPPTQTTLQPIQRPTSALTRPLQRPSSAVGQPAQLPAADKPSFTEVARGTSSVAVPKRPTSVPPPSNLQPQATVNKLDSKQPTSAPDLPSLTNTVASKPKPTAPKPAPPPRVSAMEEPFLVGEEDPFSVPFPSVPSMSNQKKEQDASARLAQPANHSARGRAGSRLSNFESRNDRKTRDISPDLPEPRYPKGLLPKGPVHYVLKAFDISQPLSKSQFEELQNEVRSKYGYEIRRRSESASRRRYRSNCGDGHRRRSYSGSPSRSRSHTRHRSRHHSVEHSPRKTKSTHSPSRARRHRYNAQFTDSKTLNGDGSDDSLETNARKEKNKRSKHADLDGQASLTRDAVEEQSVVAGSRSEQPRSTGKPREISTTRAHEKRDPEEIAAERRRKFSQPLKRGAADDLSRPALAGGLSRDVAVENSCRSEEPPPKRSRNERPASPGMNRWNSAELDKATADVATLENYQEADDEEIAAAAREFVEGSSGRYRDRTTDDKKRKKEKKLKKDKKKKKHKKHKEKSGKYHSASEENSDRSDTPGHEAHALEEDEAGHEGAEVHPLLRKDSEHEVHPLLRKESNYSFLDSEPSKQIERTRAGNSVPQMEQRLKDRSGRASLFGRAMAGIQRKS